jgi:type I restriction enzyme, R subunit
LAAVSDLSKAFALSIPDDEALEIRDDVGFFQAIRVALVKPLTNKRRQSREEIDQAIRQIIARAVSSEEVIDVFAAAGLKKPDISILNDKFLGQVRSMPQRNLAVELLRKLLANEIKVRSKKFLIQSRSFGELLEATLHKYRNRAVESTQVTSIDWTAKQSVRARLRVMVKRVLRKYGYPPDKQQKAIKTILEQAELLCAEWGVS